MKEVDAPVYRDAQDIHQEGRKQSNQVEDSLTVIPADRQLQDAETEEFVDFEFRRQEEKCTRGFTASNEDNVQRDALPDKIGKMPSACSALTLRKDAASRLLNITSHQERSGGDQA